MEKKVFSWMGVILMVLYVSLAYTPPIPPVPKWEPIPKEEVIRPKKILSEPEPQLIVDEFKPAIEFSYDEAQELLKIAYAEAGNQGTDGQWLVMSVVLNRVSDPSFPDNIHDVINQPNQFHVRGMAVAEPTSETHLALARIEQGDVARSLIAFEKVGNNALDEYFEECFEYRDHVFYAKK